MTCGLRWQNITDEERNNTQGNNMCSEMGKQ